MNRSIQAEGTFGITKNDIKRELEKMIISFFHSFLFFNHNGFSLNLVGNQANI
jgi:hypothetical protein